MHHEYSLIATIATGMGVALLLGFIAVRLKLPALVGYLVAGIVIGPATPGFVGDVAVASELAEIGIMLLMFGVGLHFSLSDLLAVRKIALPGALVQMLVATVLGTVMAVSWGWEFGAALVLGLSLSVASTVVLLKALEGRGIEETINGRIAIGWLIVEDLAMVLVLVVLPPLAGFLKSISAAGVSGPSSINGMGFNPGEMGWAVGFTLIQISIFVALMLIVGRRLFPWVLWQVAKTGSRELFTLCVLAAALSIAYGATALFGVSFALGAFFAGMVLRESKFSHRAAEQSLPLRDAFSVLFFLSVGMLFEPSVLVNQPLQVLGVVAIILVGKSIAAAAVVLLFRYPLNTALTVSAGLAQIGEFSFILASLGVSLKLLSPSGQSLIVAGALISIALNPLLFSMIEPVQRWVRSHSKWGRRLDNQTDPLAVLPQETHLDQLRRQVVLVGYGRVGKHIANTLKQHAIAFVVVEQNREKVKMLRHASESAVFGNASDAVVLIQAHIAHAACLIIATPDALGVTQMINHARLLNPQVPVVLRQHGAEQAKWAEQTGNIFGFSSEETLALAMLEKIQSIVGSQQNSSGQHP